MNWFNHFLKNRIFFVTAFLLFVATRFLFIDKFPQGLNCDEASATYEAYSIMKTIKSKKNGIISANTILNDLILIEIMAIISAKSPKLVKIDKKTCKN